MVHLHVDVSEVKQLAKDIRRHADETGPRAAEVVQKGGHDVLATAMVNTPVDTGFLRESESLDSIVGRGAGGRYQAGLGFEVGPTADYGGFVEEGVPHPYTITAKDGGMLHFVVNGQDVFVKSVVHPPSPPQPYLAPAFDHHEPLIERALADLGAQVLNRD